jgi:uncharacterized protein (TIGR02147 family)
MKFRSMEVQTDLPLQDKVTQLPILAAYVDYRQYLKDFYNYKLYESRNSYSNYSYKVFSASADIKSPNYLKMIIEGGRNLTEDTAKKFARALGLDKSGSDEFLALVEYNQALDASERNRHLKRLNELRTQKKLKSGEITEDRVNAVPKWISWVLLALADQKDADFSIDGIRNLLSRKASPDDIRKSLQQLFEQQSLVHDPLTGNIKKGMVAPPQEDLLPDTVRKIQAELMYLGMEALLNSAPQEREIGTVTVCLTEKEFEKLKFEMRHLRKRILKDALIARDSSKGDRIYQFNVQLFPLTKKSPKKKLLPFMTEPVNSDATDDNDSK